MKKTLLVICALLVSGGIFQSCKRTNLQPATVNVGGLFSLTGNWSSLGKTSKAAMEIAAEDINNYLAGKKSKFRLSVQTYDTWLDPYVAEQNFRQVAAGNTRFFMGPQSSAELAAIAPIADSAHAIVISQSSTASSLAIAGDAVYRYCPNDKVEGPAIARTMRQAGIQGLVTVSRNDAGNKGLQTSTGAAFTANGGTVIALDPYTAGSTDFTSVIAAIKAKVTQLSGTYGASHTAVYLASFDECVSLFAQIGNDPVLTGVKWYGADGVALSTALLNSEAARAFINKTGFFAPAFGLPANLESRWRPISDRIKASTGIEPDAFALSVYDAMWVLTYALETTHGVTTDHNRLKELFVYFSQGNFGVTGSTELDAYGDRDSGEFDYWSIKKGADSTYQWTVVGKSE